MKRQEASWRSKTRAEVWYHTWYPCKKIPSPSMKMDILALASTRTFITVCSMIINWYVDNEERQVQCLYIFIFSDCCKCMPSCSSKHIHSHSTLKNNNAANPLCFHSWPKETCWEKINVGWVICLDSTSLACQQSDFASIETPQSHCL